MIHRHAARFIVYPLVFFVSVGTLGGLHLWNRALLRDLSQLGDLRTVVARIRPAPVSPVRIQRPVFGARLRSGRIPVTGEAPPGASVRLWNNGELVGVVRADKRGHFEFQDVPLVEEGNLLQVEYHLPDGRDGFAPAILVYRPPRARPDEHYVQRSPDNLYRGNRNRREVALTFDGAHSDRDVNDLLRVVTEEQVPVTVFLTGEFIRRHPDATRKLAASPWIEVGNHTLDHPHLTTYAQNRRQRTAAGLTPAVLMNQLNETAHRFYTVTGKMMVPLWRAPYGEHNPEIRAWAASQGYTHVGWTTGRGWSLDSLDWVDDPSHPHYRPARTIVKRWLALARRGPDGINGGIMLMHLGTKRVVGDRMVDYLPRLVKGLRAMGYQFVFVTTMLKHLRQPPLVAREPVDSSAAETASAPLR